MSEQQNVDLVRSAYDAFARADIQGVLELLTENIEWASSGPQELPTSGVRRGREQVARFFQALDQTFEMQRFEPRTFVAQDDRVIVLGSDTVRVKATGKVLTEEWAHVFTVHNGRISAFREYIDTAAIVAELRAAQART